MSLHSIKLIAVIAISSINYEVVQTSRRKEGASLYPRTTLRFHRNILGWKHSIRENIPCVFLVYKVTYTFLNLEMEVLCHATPRLMAAGSNRSGRPVCSCYRRNARKGAGRHNITNYYRWKRGGETFLLYFHLRCTAFPRAIACL